MKEHAKEYHIKSGLLDRQRKLTLAHDYLEWESGDLRGHEFTKLNKSDILDFKHTMTPLVWYEFIIGKHFAISIKAKSNVEIEIRFSSYFGLHKANKQKYCDIVGDIWRLYHSRNVSCFLDAFYSDGQVEAQGIKLKREGIEVRKQKGLIPWHKVATTDYFNYFAIYHQDNSFINCIVNYDEYGAETLWSAIKTILKDYEVERRADG